MLSLLLLLLLLLPFPLAASPAYFQEIDVCPTQQQQLRQLAASGEAACVVLCSQLADCFAVHASGSDCRVSDVVEFFSRRWRPAEEAAGDVADCRSFVRASGYTRQQVLDQLFHVFYDFRLGFDNLVSVGNFTDLATTGVNVVAGAEGAELGEAIDSFVEIRDVAGLFGELVPTVAGYGEFANFSAFVSLRRHALPSQKNVLMWLCKCTSKFQYEMFLREDVDASGLKPKLFMPFYDGGKLTNINSKRFEDRLHQTDSWTSYTVSFRADRTSDLINWADFYVGGADITRAAVTQSDATYLTRDSRSCLRIGYHAWDAEMKLVGTLRCFGLGRPALRLHDVRPLQLLC